MLEPKSPSSSSLLKLGPPGSGLLPQTPGTRRDPQSPELEPLLGDLARGSANPRIFIIGHQRALED